MYSTLSYIEGELIGIVGGMKKVRCGDTRIWQGLLSLLPQASTYLVRSLYCQRICSVSALHVILPVSTTRIHRAAAYTGQLHILCNTVLINTQAPQPDTLYS